MLLKIGSLDEVETKLGESAVRCLEVLAKTPNHIVSNQCNRPSCGPLAKTWCGREAPPRRVYLHASRLLAR